MLFSKCIQGLYLLSCMVQEQGNGKARLTELIFQPRWEQSWLLPDVSQLWCNNWDIFNIAQHSLTTTHYQQLKHCYWLRFICGSFIPSELPKQENLDFFISWPQAVFPGEIIWDVSRCLHFTHLKELDNPQLTCEMGMSPEEQGQLGTAPLTLGRAGWGQAGALPQCQTTPLDIFPHQGAKPMPMCQEKALVLCQDWARDAQRQVTPPCLKPGEKPDFTHYFTVLI